MTENVTITQQQVEVPEYIIDPEFQNVFSAKEAEQYEELKEAIRREGKIRDPLVVWDETTILVDGHRRHRIYKELREELGDKFRIEPPKIIRMSFANRDEAKMWMIHNQIMRRNLTTFQRVEAALQFKEFFAAKARENQKAGVSLNSEKGIVVDDELAKLAKTSSDTVGKVRKILANAKNAGVTKAITALRRGDAHISIHSVYKQYCVKAKKAKPSSSSLPPPAPQEESDSAPVCNQQIEGILGTTPGQVVGQSIEHEPETILPLESNEEQSRSLEEQIAEYIALLDEFVAERSLPEERVLVRERIREWANSGESEDIIQPLE